MIPTELTLRGGSGGTPELTTLALRSSTELVTPTTIATSLAVFGALVVVAVVLTETLTAGWSSHPMPIDRWPGLLAAFGMVLVAGSTVFDLALT